MNVFPVSVLQQAIYPDPGESFETQMPTEGWERGRKLFCFWGFWLNQCTSLSEVLTGKASRHKRGKISACQEVKPMTSDRFIGMLFLQWYTGHSLNPNYILFTLSSLVLYEACGLWHDPSKHSILKARFCSFAKIQKCSWMCNKRDKYLTILNLRW